MATPVVVVGTVAPVDRALSCELHTALVDVDRALRAVSDRVYAQCCVTRTSASAARRAWLGLRDWALARARTRDMRLTSFNQPQQPPEEPALGWAADLGHDLNVVIPTLDAERCDTTGAVLDRVYQVALQRMALWHARC